MGTWIGNVMKHVDSATTGRCRWCEALEEETWEHRWWRCPAFDEVRKKWFPEFRQGDEAMLPGVLRNAGICPEPVVAQGAAYWGGDPGCASRRFQELCGVHGLQQWVEASCLNRAGQDSVPLRLVLAHLQEEEIYEELPINEVQGRAPEVISVFTDGGVM